MDHDFSIFVDIAFLVAIPRIFFFKETPTARTTVALSPVLCMFFRFFFSGVLRCGTRRVKFSCNAYVLSLAEMELTTACQEIIFNKINILKIFF